MGKINYSTYSGVKKRLLEIFRKESFPNNRLPSEAELSSRLGVSLVTLRESLLMLAMEGFITKKHGAGNFVHPSALDPKMRIDLVNSFSEMLELSGYKTEYKLVQHYIEPASITLAAQLGITTGANIFVAEWLYTADGKNTIHSINRIPEAMLALGIPAEIPNISIDDFLWELCRKETSHAISKQIPLLADKKLRDLFDLKTPTAVLKWEQVFYSVQDEKLCFNEVFFHPEICILSSLRNRYFRE
ncbi:MAG: GntR family transcriptional regulator [Clostridia bacterium]